MPKLSVNIDHVATVRQARRGASPDPIAAAREVEAAGADGVTVHLREDRRHIQDADVRKLREMLRLPLNFEMAATPQMVAFAIEISPASAMLVPEGRNEITTEGGLDVVGGEGHLRDVISRLREAGVKASVFIDAVPAQVKAAARVGAGVCEIHTGPYAHAHLREGGLGPSARLELAKVREMGAMIRDLGMQFNAGHALDYANVQEVAALDGVCELHIGHSVVSRALFVGMRAAVTEMKALTSGERDAIPADAP